MIYADMKSSCQAWLGEVPAHWEVVPHRAIFHEIDYKNNKSEELLSVTIGRGVIPQSRLLAESAGKKDSSRRDKSSYKLVIPGDIAYNKMRAWQGAIGMSLHRGIISPAYIVQRLRSADLVPRFYHYLMRTSRFAKEAERWSYGITSDMWSLRPEHFKRIYTVVPPLHEQLCIVRYLDHATARLNRVVAAKRRVVRLLEEQKRTIIQRAVMRGLDANRPMKDGGSPQLREVPADWDVVMLKVICRNLNRRRRPLSASQRGLMKQRNYPYYGASGIIDQVDEYIFDDELVLIAEDGANLVLRNLPLAIIARGKFWVNNHAHILKPVDGCVEYLAALLETLDYKPWITGAAQPKLTKDRLMAIRVGAPPAEEQRAIVAYFQAENEPANRAIASLGREIALLDEYRTTLIAEVVTGKRDVRVAAAELPTLDSDAEIPEDDALAEALLEEAAE